ncbi:DDE-type integrase/transposase/recombinase [Termitidicoccus mucosus]
MPAYLPTAKGWLYLAVIIDAHSRRVLGHAFTESLATDFAIAALEMPVLRRGGKCELGLVLHSNRNVQYASERFRARLAAHGIRASMSRCGNCHDYRAKRQHDTSSLGGFLTLKIELVYL